MTSRERVEAALSFEEPDRVPFNFWLDECSNPAVPRYFAERYGDDFRVDRYGVDVIEVFPGVEWPHNERVMSDGRRWRRTSDSLSLADLLCAEWPSADDEAVGPIRRALEKTPDRAVFAIILGVLTATHEARTYQHQMMDIYDNPAALRRVYDRVSTIAAGLARQVCRLGITAIYFGEDIASTTGLMISPEMLDEFVWPYNSRAIDEARERGIPVVYHSDGNTMAILDKLVSLGISGISPVQPHLNDLDLLKDGYHGKLAVYGALDNTFVIPRGSPQEVREHIRSTFRRLGRGGGLLLSGGAIPYTAPPENIEAMVAAIREECVYTT